MHKSKISLWKKSGSPWRPQVESQNAGGNSDLNHR